ncbi:LicD [Plasmopara halstedii]|uniref:LicD n=1 Tax=Plasmopara halstedii TaxID=4781 RepID=A0A0P1AXN0_PLAHL|nr:LicD [Plasmopara halstedii]CEG46076.1 LicD [Plasmopara halstedii]|eukprot:XP_024582445.1 LicD [Plasmopara halstedii]
MFLFGLYLLYAPDFKGGPPSDQMSSSGLLRRCISNTHRDVRYVKGGTCITADQRLHALEDLVYSLKVMLENANVVYWIDSGTLLGVYRAQQLVPWDYNADFGITMSGLEYLRTTSDDVIEMPDGYELTVFNSSLYRAGTTSSGVPARFVDTEFGFYANIFAFENFKGLFKDDVRPATAPLIQEVEVGNGVVVESLMGPTPSEFWHRCVHCPNVEMEEEEDEDSDMTTTSNATVVKHFRVPQDWIFPLRTCRLELFEVMCPAQMAPYLMFIFGNRFLTPEIWE